MNNVSTISIIFLSGLNEIRYYKSLLFFLSFLCYSIIILVNVCVVLSIILNNELHEPMYILLCAICMNSLYGTAGFYPKFLSDLLSPVHVISYSGCLLQTQVLYFFAYSDLSILALMAYDQYRAICRLLEYHSVMSKQRVITLVCLACLTPFCFIAVNTILTSRLKLCNPYLNKIICLNWSIVMLACFPSEAAPNSMAGYFTIAFYALHFWLIVWSYIFLIKTCVGSIEIRRKYMQTCVPHLISFTFSLTPLFYVMCFQFGSKDLSDTFKNFKRNENFSHSSYNESTYL